METLEVGDKVAVRGGYMNREAIEVHTVSRVLKRFVELENGAQFTHTGSAYPHRDYSTSFMVALTPELEAEARRQKFVRFLGSRKWDSYSTETLAKVMSLVREKPTVSEPGAEE